MLTIFASASLFAEEIKNLFPNLYGQPSVELKPCKSKTVTEKVLKVGVVLSGGQAPGGHNVIAGMFGES